MPWRDTLKQYERIPGLLQLLGNTAQAMCAPFWWSLQNDANKPATIVHNGTICYLDTGTSELGVTADHVLAEYLADLALHGIGSIECQFGGSTIKPEDRIIARHTNLDIATLSVPEVFVAAAFQSQTMQHDFRGMSGGPVFRVVDEGIVRLELTAFICEFMFDADVDGNPIGDGHTVLARHADFVAADGALTI